MSIPNYIAAMKPFTEALRYEYPGLTRDSLVLDAGAHEGLFAVNIHNKYGCSVWCFEPVKEFHDALKKTFENTPRIAVFSFGIGAKTHKEKFKIKGCMSGAFADQGKEEEVNLVSIVDVVASMAGRECDLLKLNIEGGEFSVLEAILDHGLAKHFKNIQVQFHPVIPDCRERRDRIRERLTKTHRLTYDEPWIWEGWERQ